MLGWNDVELASIIFHELTHQLIYLPNDADFNEALATTVEQEGVRRWLTSLDRERDLARYQVEQKRFVEVLDLLNRTRAELRTLFASGLDPADMRRQKAAVYAGCAAPMKRAGPSGAGMPLSTPGSTGRSTTRISPRSRPTTIACRDFSANSLPSAEISMRSFGGYANWGGSIRRSAMPRSAKSPRAGLNPALGPPPHDRGSSARCPRARRDIAVPTRPWNAAGS